MSEQFEDKVKHLLADLQIEPNDAVWQQVRQAVRPVKKKRRFIFWWLLPLALGAGTWVFFNTDGDDVHSTQTTAEISAAPKDVTRLTDVKTPVYQNLETDGPNPPALQYNASSSVSSDPANTVSQAVDKIKTDDDSSRISAAQTTMDPGTRNYPGDSYTTLTPVQQGGDASRKDSATDLLSPAQSAGSPDTAVASFESGTATTITPVKKRGNWRWAVVAETGVTTLVNGFGFGAGKAMEASYNGVPPGSTAGSSFQPLRERNTSRPGLSTALMLMAERTIGKRSSLQLGAGWRLQSFSLHRAISKDSTTAGLVSPVVLSDSKTAYRLHSLNVFTGAEYRLLKDARFSLSIGGGIDNQWVMGARVLTKSSTPFPGGPSESLIKGPSAFYQWQPQVDLHLSAEFSLGKTRLECIPWFRQGLRQLQKDNVNATNYLMSYGLRTAFFIR